MHVAVLMGGVSREREISMLSGEGVAQALEARGHRVTRVVVRDEMVEELGPLAPDVAFVALHGRFGEDGGIQRRCEALRIPYTGSGPEASARALDKDAAKRAFVRAGVPTAEWLVIEPPLRAAAAGALLEGRPPGYPCVVKPLAEGSSIGVSIVRSREELGPALAAIESMGPAIVETFIAGREFTVGILGETALPPIELIPRRAFFDYQAKYEAGSGTEYAIDPPLDPALRRSLLENGLAAHRSLGCGGCSRVDLRVDGAGRPFVLEVNTIPGMTPRSLFPKAAAAASIGYGELCERLIEHALARAATAALGVAAA